MEEQLSFQFNKGKLSAWFKCSCYWERHGIGKSPCVVYARIVDSYRQGYRYIVFLDDEGEKINWKLDALFKPTLEEAQAAADTILLSHGYILDK